MKLFEYAVIFNPSENERKKGTTSKLVVPVSTVLATDQNGATILAAREIPKEYLDRLDQLQVAIRPF